MRFVHMWASAEVKQGSGLQWVNPNTRLLIFIGSNWPLIAAVILRVTHLCHVYSSFFFLPSAPPDQNGPVHVGFATPPQASTHQPPWLEAQQHWRKSGECTSVRLKKPKKKQRLDHRCVCPGASTVAEGELFDLLSGGQAKGLPSAKQIRLSLLRLVTLFITWLTILSWADPRDHMIKIFGHQMS